MPVDLLIAFVTYVFVTTITPGPNNAMLLASGVNFGLRRTVPHILGVTIGFCILMILVGFGLGTLFVRYPILHQILKVVGASYMLYLAWNIARSSSVDDGVTKGKPMTFLQAALFQWVNPKAWIMILGAITTYVPIRNYTMYLLGATFLFLVIGGPCISTWAAFGAALSNFLKNPRQLRIFNVTMALLLVLSLYPLLR
jgi:threonine/homoserine/homoserine lactone efflux protein